MEEADLAYLAGIIDGEGCIRIRRRRRGSYWCYYSYIRVAMTNQSVLMLLQYHLGGYVGKQTKLPSHRKEQYYWGIECRAAIIALQKLLPYLKIKKAEAELAIKFNAAMKPYSKPRGVASLNPSEREELEKVRYEYFTKMKALKH